MKLHSLVLGILPFLSLTVLAQAPTTTLDWKFSNTANPASPTPSGTVNPSNATATATFSGGMLTYIFGQGPEGIYGTPTGLWAMEQSATAPQLTLNVNQTPVSTVDLSLVVTHFVDNLQFPGAISLALGDPATTTPTYQYSREVVIPQTGVMTGSWVADTYSWGALNYADFDLRQLVINLVPGAASGGLLLDEVKLTIVGEIAVPEPMVGQLAGLGLLLFGVRSWLSRRARN